MACKSSSTASMALPSTPYGLFLPPSTDSASAYFTKSVCGDGGLLEAGCVTSKDLRCEGVAIGRVQMPEGVVLNAFPSSKCDGTSVAYPFFAKGSIETEDEGFKLQLMNGFVCSGDSLEAKSTTKTEVVTKASPAVTTVVLVTVGIMILIVLLSVTGGRKRSNLSAVQIEASAGLLGKGNEAYELSNTNDAVLKALKAS